MVISRATSIQFLPRDDHITLEYNDRVILTFTPQNPHLLAGIEAAGQYIRQNTTINIIDTDSQSSLMHGLTTIHFVNS